MLFNVYTQHSSPDNIRSLRYVYDTVLVSDTKEGLQSLVTAAKIESEKAGLDMNDKRPKQECNIKADIKIIAKL